MCRCVTVVTAKTPTLAHFGRHFPPTRSTLSLLATNMTCWSICGTGKQVSRLQGTRSQTRLTVCCRTHTHCTHICMYVCKMPTSGVCVCVCVCVRACVRACVWCTVIYPLIPLVRCLVLTSQKMAAILLRLDTVWSNSGTLRHKTRSVNHTGLLPASWSTLLAPPTDHTSITLTPPAFSKDVHSPFKVALLCLAST